jgi:hypothetical protein
MEEHSSAAARQYAALTHEIAGTQQGYRYQGRWISVTPYWPARGGIAAWIPDADAAARRLSNVPYNHLPASREDETRAWVGYPYEEERYEAFVRYVLTQASMAEPDDPTAVPFATGLRDGIDVRATLRHWKDGTIYVRDERRTPLKITNGIIDFTNRSEHTAVLRGRGVGDHSAGWIDPSLDHVGSASREARDSIVLQDQPCHVSLHYRELALITTDVPTSLPKGSKVESFYERVIRKLVHLEPDRDNLYSWLGVMFSFCSGEPIVYHSHYIPGPKIHAIARQHRVRVVHRPLRQIPRPLREENRRFRFLNLTRAQWETLLERIAESKRAWGADGHPAADRMDGLPA